MKKYLQKLDTLGLLFLVAAVIWYSVSDIWNKWNLGLAILGGVFIVIGIAANYRQILDTLGKRSTKYAGNYVISLILVLAVVSGLNYIGHRHPKRFDTTGIGRFTLAPQTVQILKKLKQDVDVKAFFQGGENASFKELLVEFRTESPRIHYEFIDPDKQPDVAKQYDITAYGTVIISVGGRKEKIEKRSEAILEEDLTNAIIRAGRSEAKKVYFIQGHGEKDISADDRTGYAEAKKALEGQGYKVDALNLASDGKIPDDAKVIIEAGPATELFPQEIQLINDFLNRGGVGMFALVDPQAPSLEAIFTNLGIQIDNDVVLDTSSEGRLMGSTIPIVRKYESHKITDQFKPMTIFPFTRSIQPGKNISGITVETLFKSNVNSWGETDLKSKEATLDPAKDLKGPLSLAVAATKEIKPSSEKSPAVKTRIVVTGTSSFPMNSFWAAGGNANLFLNMISWLAQDEDLISIRPKSPSDRRIILSQSQLSLVRLFTVFMLPGIVLIVGVAVIMNRRRK